MFKRKEKQSLLEARTKNLKKAEQKIEELAQKNLVVLDKNKHLRLENDKQEELIKRIADLVNSNRYNNEKAVLNKIKELISDYRSQN